MTKQIQKIWTITELRLAMQLWRDGETKEKIAESLGRGLGSVHDQIQRNRAMFPRRVERGTKANPVEYVEIKVKIPKALHHKMKGVAKDRGMYFSKFVREAIKHYLQDTPTPCREKHQSLE